MAINQEMKGMIKGIIIAIGTWMIVQAGRELIIDTSPIKNEIILGALMIVAVLLWK